MNIWHKPARAPQIPGTLTLCTNSTHPYQNKDFADQNSEFLSALFSNTCAHSRLQPLCFDMLHKNTRGEEGTQSPTIPSRIGMGGGAKYKEAAESLDYDKVLKRKLQDRLRHLRLGTAGEGLSASLERKSS